MKMTRIPGSAIATIAVLAATILSAGPAAALEAIDDDSVAAEAVVAAEEVTPTPDPLPVEAPIADETPAELDAGEPSPRGPEATASPALSGSPVGPTPMSVITGYKLVSVSKAGNYVDRSREIARCNVATTGLSCSINKTSSATRTIDLALGMSRAGVAATWASATATACRCRSPATPVLYAQDSRWSRTPSAPGTRTR